MTISKAFIETIDNQRMEAEMQAVYEELQSRKMPVELFTNKKLQRRQVALSNDTLVVGYVDSILTALKILGIEHPPTNDYPDSLKPFLHRKIGESTVSAFIQQIYDGSKAIFAKPKDRKKRFTGRIFSHPSDVAPLSQISQRTVLYCSEVVEWLSEYRVFVNQGNIVGSQHYSGDEAIMLDEDVVQTAVDLLERSNEATSAYAVDFGVLATGETALVEWNDAFSLGSYGLDKAIYADLLITRWIELMKT